MKCRFTKHALHMMGMRGIKKEEVSKVVNSYDKKWISKKNKKNEVFTLDKLTVVRNVHNGCIITVYRYGEVEKWHK